jgi:hypothetical protein
MQQICADTTCEVGQIDKFQPAHRTAVQAHRDAFLPHPQGL